jgi:hypothetical protein
LERKDGRDRADGTGLSSRTGTALLALVADRVGLTGGLCDALAGTCERRSAHDPGRVLCDLAVMLADGGRCLSDIQAIAGQASLFGEASMPPRSTCTPRSSRPPGSTRAGSASTRCLFAVGQEVLAGIMRPGNAGANNADDHLELLDLALEQLPATEQVPSEPRPRGLR